MGEAIRRTIRWEMENPLAGMLGQSDYAAEDAAVADTMSDGQTGN
jgi:hypothetical protein